MRFFLPLLAFMASPVAAQSIVDAPDGRVEGTFMGDDIAVDVACTKDADNFIVVTSHLPIDFDSYLALEEDAVYIIFVAAGIAIAVKSGEDNRSVLIRDTPSPVFPLTVDAGPTQLTITCPEDFS